MTVGELLNFLNNLDKAAEVRLEFYHEESDSKIIAEIGDVGWDDTSIGYLLREE